jgi:hypothetical protein
VDVDQAAGRQFDANLADLGWLGGFPPVVDALADDTVPWVLLEWARDFAVEPGWRGFTRHLHWRGIAGLDHRSCFVVLPETCEPEFGKLMLAVTGRIATRIPWERRRDGWTQGTLGAHRPPAEILDHYERWATTGLRIHGELILAAGEPAVTCPVCGVDQGLLLTLSTVLVCPHGHRWSAGLSSVDVLPLMVPPPTRLDYTLRPRSGQDHG